MKSAMAKLTKEAIDAAGDRFTTEDVSGAVLRALTPQMLWEERHGLVRDFVRTAIRRVRGDDRRAYERAELLSEEGVTSQYVLFDDMEQPELVSVRRHCAVSGTQYVEKHNRVTRYLRTKFAMVGLALLRLVEVDETDPAAK